MKVCEQTAKAAPERELRYNDLKMGDVFRWERRTENDPYNVKDERGHTYLTGRYRGKRHTQSPLIDGNYLVVVYPDACLEPGTGLTITTS